MSTAAPSALPPVKVLIVDDSAMVRRVLSTGLSADPMIEVVGAVSSAEAAWTLMQDLRPDVVTLDIEMPGMDGLTFLRRLRAMPGGDKSASSAMGALWAPSGRSGAMQR